MTRPITDPLLSRPVPAFDPLAAFFWASGADEQLRILRCGRCGFYVHPPSHPCPQCFSAQIAPAVVSGDGTVATCTVNVQEWIAGQRPYSIAVVELDEQQGLRLTSNVVDCDPYAVHIGQRVGVRFIHRNDIYYPVFVPAGRGGR